MRYVFKGIKISKVKLVILELRGESESPVVLWKTTESRLVEVGWGPGIGIFTKSSKDSDTTEFEIHVGKKI